jgi:cobyrinic acid a,c-diamide synthase
MVSGRNPFYKVGERVKGHEFRYSEVLSWDGDQNDLAFEMERGVGFLDDMDGLVCKNVLALYTHIHALSTPQWAGRMVARALEFKTQRETA